MARTTPVHSGYTIINGTGTGSNGNRIDVWVEYKLGTQSVAGNYTPITAYFYAALNPSYTSTTQYYQGLNSSFKVDGKSGTGVSNGAYDFTSSGKLNLLGSYSGNINHNQDGTKNVTLAGSFTTVSSYISGGSVSASISLPTIPRASTIGAMDADIEDISAVTIDTNSTTFTHSVAYKFGTLTGYLTEAGGISASEVKLSTASIPFLIPKTFYSQIPNGPSGTCTLTCRTYSGSTQIGDAQTCTFRVTANEDLCRPDVSGTVEDINAATLALTGDKNTFIRLMSTAGCTITAEPKHGASIKQKKIGGVAAGADNTRAIGNLESDSILFEAVDSRDYPGRYPMALRMIPYVKLTNNAKAERTDPVSGYAVLTLKGNCFKGNFGLTDNTLTARYQINSGEEVALPLEILDDNSYSATVALEKLDYTQAHRVSVTVEDALDRVTVTLTVERGFPVFDWGKDDFNVNGQFRINEKPVADFVLGQGTEGGWTWRKWNSGVAECWCNYRHQPTEAGDNAVNIDYPFVFTDSPVVTATLGTNGTVATDIIGCNSAGNRPNALSQCELLLRGVSNTKWEVDLQINAIGRWK